MARLKKYINDASKQKAFREKSKGKTEEEVMYEFPELYTLEYQQKHATDVPVKKPEPEMVKKPIVYDDLGEEEEEEIDYVEEEKDTVEEELTMELIAPSVENWEDKRLWNNLRFLSWLAQMFGVKYYGQMRVSELKKAIAEKLLQ